MIDLSSIPLNPGCYLFKGSGGKVIYVGKAKVLRKRVSSYFNREHDSRKTDVLVSKIKDVDFIVTDSEYEALVLENNLIKKYRPRYNIDLKDSRRYAYLMLTDEDFPRLVVARDRKAKGEYFGPFVSGLNRDYVLRTLQKIFGIRTCVKMPKRACLRYSLGLCSGACVGAISREDYLKDVDSVRKVLKGRTGKIIEVLNREMKMFSARQDFERAMRIRDQIRALKDLGERQKVERDKKYNEDVINFVVYDSDSSRGLTRTDADKVRKRVFLTVFNSRKGMLDNKQDFEFDFEEGFLERFLVSYYSENEVAREIVLPVKVSEDVERFLGSLGRTRVVVPERGDKKNLLDLVLKNIEISLFGDMRALEELRDSLKLGDLPRVIECFDISHLSGTSTVASMVVFRNGRASKGDYRRYRIRGLDGSTGSAGNNSTRIHADSRGFVQNDDFASMKEVVSRRYTKLRDEGLAMPDLVLIDGGKGQLSAVLEVLDEIGVKVAVASIAKKEEEVFVPGRKSSIMLNRKGGALKLVQAVRDEAHRFAIGYNRKLRSKKVRE